MGGDAIDGKKLGRKEKQVGEKNKELNSGHTAFEVLVGHPEEDLTDSDGRV